MKPTKIAKNIVSAFNAKSHLSRLLREVQKGQIFTITMRGRPIAQLVPFPKTGEKNMEKDQIIKEFDSIRERIKMKVDIKSYIQEGRKLGYNFPSESMNYLRYTN